MTEPRRFTTKAPVPFVIDDDEVFHVLGAIPAEELAELLDLQAGLSVEGVGVKEQYEGVKRMFQSAMLPESWDRFSLRLSDRSRPVDFNLLIEITQWLAGEVWSGKAITSSLTSSTGSPDPTGTTSTDGVPVEGLTPVEISVVPDI